MRLPEVQEVSLPITREWINNVLKYAQAAVVDVPLIGDESELVITVEDNSKRFNRDQLKRSKGNGWKNIHSRLNSSKNQRA